MIAKSITSSNGDIFQTPKKVKRFNFINNLTNNNFNLIDNVNQYEINNETVKIDAIYNAIKTYNILINNEQCYENVYSTIIEILFNIKKFDIFKSIKTIFSSSLGNTLFIDLASCPDIYNDNNIDTHMKYCISLFKNNVIKKNKEFYENDIFCDIPEFTFINNILNGTTDQFIDIIFNDNEIFELYEQILTLYCADLRKEEIHHPSLLKMISQFYAKIKILCTNYDHFISNDKMYLAYMIPYSIYAEKDNTNIIYTVDDIIGKGNYGFVVKYKSWDNKCICVKFYFGRNNDYEVINKINNNDELSDVFPKSLYVEKYYKSYENNDNVVFQDHNYSPRKFKFMIMEYCEQLNSINALKTNDIMFNVIEKTYKLFKNGLYFSDLKLEHIVYSRRMNDICFIDYDSFFFLEKSHKYPVFSFTDLVKPLITGPNGKIYGLFNKHNLYILEKVVVFMLSIFILDLNKYDVHKLHASQFPVKWNEFITTCEYSHFISTENASTLSKIYQGIDNIPSFNSVMDIFNEIKYDLNK
jgi:predicted Ser/Thr protein kinase